MNDHNQYLEDHHHITETGVGLAKLHLKQDSPSKALEALELCSKRLKALRANLNREFIVRRELYRIKLEQEEGID